MPDKTYLGDGVYAQRRTPDGAVVLTTENGLRETNMIVLEDQVIEALLLWLERPE